jgi:pimeloyl-ACP methyl ester carboxylesterase
LVAAIPYLDFGGEGPVAHFAHANGYPPACYKRMIAPLLDHFQVVAAYHRPLWPGSQPEEISDWHTIADDLMRFFDQEKLSGVVGIGHSLGAVATMHAAVKRPELFRALVLIEPVFLMPSILQLFAGGPVENPLANIASSRRHTWPSRQAVFEHFRPKRVFARWSDDTLWDYATHGTRKVAAGEVVLAYSPEWEARIYSLVPADVWEVLPKVRQPTLGIRGGETETLVPAAWQLWQIIQPQAQFLEIAGAGHMLPMEQPRRVANAILAFTRGL